ncbi:MAG: O-antigen ligase family protein [Moraxellaceae bacterium]|nr:O-antigen ligase family protein [Moraxellaceae bacterium]
MTPTLSSLTAWLQKTTNNFDALAFLIVMSMCLLGATNGVGSMGMQLAFILVIYLHPELSKQWWRVSRYFVLTAVLLLLALVAYSFNYKQALHDAWGVTRGLLMSLLAVYLLQVSGQQLYRVLTMTLMMCSLLATGVVLWNVHQYGLQETIERQWLDTVMHRNRLGQGLAMAFIVGLAALLSQSQPLYRQKLLLSCVLWLGAVSYINHSRGALLAMIVAGMVMLFLWNWRKALIVESIGLVVALIINHLGILSKIATHNGGSLGNGREFLWPPIFERVLQNPWFGHGLHAVNNDPVLLAQKIEAVSHVHSIYLDIVYASGLMGFLFWGIWTLLFAKNIKKILTPNNNMACYLGLGLLTYILVHGVVDLAFYSVGTSAILAFSGVLTIGLFVKERSHENTAHS